MKRITIAAIVLATAALAVLFSLDAQWGWAIAIVLVGGLWLSEPRHGWRWVATFSLLVFTTAALFGALFNLSAFVLLSSLAATLVAWDLDHFAHYLDGITDIRDETELEKRHMRRLAAAVGLGWALGVVALGVRITLDFSLTLVLGILVIIGLARAIRHTGRESEGSQTDQSQTQ